MSGVLPLGRGVPVRSAVPIRWYEPWPGSVASPGPTLLWLHGGGFFRGGLDQPEAHDVARSLAARGVRVATVDYRLAPPPGPGLAADRLMPSRGRYPMALDDVVAAYGDVSDRSPAGVVVGGASAGACLAAAATLRTIDDGRPPVGAVFAYGFFHATHPRVAERDHRSRGHRGLSHARWALDVMNRNYAGSRSVLADRLAFPGGHDLSGFPRTLVVNAERDNMRASGDLFAKELADAGAGVRHHVVPGARHAFLNRPRLADYAHTVSLAAEWIRGG
ncbi:alpha/beta hydrolase [Frigoribacterium sp. VKM Ac-2836]|uniref:alpha/beta hydrolase n=1 Tax=Frigoribacterium sp. VKM Ac-2836 TaxID=2739014 RepID=UPI0015641271|nr:alpha/beta hydrolase fold domain-containing protein [Frigoribacterium sp. VKM Ac-2836]